MKKIALLSLTLLFSSLLWAQSTRNLSSFTKVSAQEGIDVFLKKGSEETAEIDARGIDEDEVLTEVSGGTLKIHLEGNNHRNIDVKVYVTYVELTGLRSSSASSIIVEDAVNTSGDFDIDCSSAGNIDVDVTADEVEIEVSSAADANVNVKANSVDIQVSSAGDVDISGSVKEAEINASSSGDVDGYDLVAEEAELRASSGASIRITVTEELEARASSGADIRYKGSPKYRDSNSSSGGSVKQS